MMALANLLHHPIIGAQTMKGLIGGRKIKRSNKDLGRVLALAWLSEDQEEDSVLQWSEKWLEALKRRFPSQWRDLAVRAGRGLRELLESNHEPDLDEARHTCASGLLASRPLTIEALWATGQRLIQDAIEPLALAAVRQYPARVSWLDNGVHDPTTEVTSFWVNVDDEKVRVRVSDEVTKDQTPDAIRAKVEELLIAAASSGSAPGELSIRSADFVPGPQREEE